MNLFGLLNQGIAPDPNKSCPNGFERHEDDETSACFPIQMDHGSVSSNGADH